VGANPRASRTNLLDRAGGARFFNRPPWVVTHSYSLLTTSWSEFGGSVNLRPAAPGGRGKACLRSRVCLPFAPVCSLVNN